MNTRSFALITCLTLVGCGHDSEKRQDRGVVSRMEYGAGYSTLMPMLMGNKSVMLIPQYHPPAWTVSVHAVHDWCIPVSKEFYEGTELGDPAVVTYVQHYSWCCSGNVELKVQFIRTGKDAKEFK